MHKKGAKHNEVIPKHMVNICRTTVRMDADLWTEFKKETKSLNLTTCLVYRALIRQWIEGVRGKIRHTKTENAKRLDRILRDTHNRIQEEKGERWIYYKPSMTLYDPKFLPGRLLTASCDPLKKWSSR